MLDNRTIGEANEFAVLFSLHRFGWLTTKMVAALQWPGASQAEAMARRTLRNLLAQKLLLKRKADGVGVWTLSAAGARSLREQHGVQAQSGQTLKVEQALHRACSNWYLIGKLKDGFKVWTEYEIQTGRAPWGRLEGKTADGLVDTEQGLIWVEVENAWKNRARRHDIAALCQRHLAPEHGSMTPLGGDNYLAGVAVVGTNITALRSMLQTFQDGLELGTLRDSHLSLVEMVYLPVGLSLGAGEGWTQQLWADVLMPR